MNRSAGPAVDTSDIPRTPRKNDAFTWADYERLLVARYINGGHTPETALQFARGEIDAIRGGNHWTHGEPTPADPHALTVMDVIANLSPDGREDFTERAGILEYDAGMSRADAEARAIAEMFTRRHPTPEKTVYRGLAALKKTLAAGVPLKDFYAKSRDNDPAAYTADIQETAALWERDVRRFKAFVRGRFVAVDIDRHPGKADGLESFYRVFPREAMPRALRDIPRSFPCYVTTPSGGFHLYFRYDGPELKLRELAPAVEVKEWQITAPGSVRETGGYVLHGEPADAPPLYGVILERVENVKRERAKPRVQAAADRPVRYTPRITLDDLAGEAAAAYAGHHDRQVSFAGRSCRCKFSGAETLAFVKSRPDIFGNDADTESTILSVFRDNGGDV
jgi:hypothetical protein